MKPLLIILTLTFLSNNSLFAINKDSSQIISVNVEIIVPDKENIPIDSPWYHQDYYAIFTLSNTQDTPVVISCMTCSWFESFLTDCDSIHVSGWGCDVNACFPHKLLAGQSMKFYGIVRSRIKQIDYKHLPVFKVGFVNLTCEDIDWGPRLNKKEKLKKKVFWSKEIELKSKITEYEIINNKSY